jgi:hypothetical protein
MKFSATAAMALASSSAIHGLNVSIDASKPTHDMNPLYMGCHSDSGFVHQVRGWSSQMVFGESFETPADAGKSPGQSSYAWNNQISASLVGRTNITADPSTPFFKSEYPSKKITISKGAALDGAAASAGLSNRGLGNEGLYFQKGKEYEGYFFVSAAKPVALEVRLESTGGKTVLASQTVQHRGGASGFVQHKFSLTPSAGTECVGIAPGSDPSVHCTSNPGTQHVCIQCGGQVTVALVAPADGSAAEANVNYVVLQAGEWGRFKGLDARRDVADSLASMGVRVIRLGGSFCSVAKDDGEYYQWQRWTGPVWERPSVGAHWDSYGGNAYNLIGGWGPFEMIDYAVALGAEPVITTTMTSSPDEFADLVPAPAPPASRAVQPLTLLPPLSPLGVELAGGLLLVERQQPNGEAAHRRRPPEPLPAEIH